MAALTINSQREHAIDFTEPFLNLGISIIMRGPEPPNFTDSFLFLSPFTFEVWMLTLLAYIGKKNLFIIIKICLQSFKRLQIFILKL